MSQGHLHTRALVERRALLIGLNRMLGEKTEEVSIPVTLKDDEVVSSSHHHRVVRQLRHDYQEAVDVLKRRYDNVQDTLSEVLVERDAATKTRDMLKDEVRRLEKIRDDLRSQISEAGLDAGSAIQVLRDDIKGVVERNQQLLKQATEHRERINHLGVVQAELLDALHNFVMSIEQTGGVRSTEIPDSYAPVADPDWTDLGRDYVNAVNILRRFGFRDREPIVAPDEETGEEPYRTYDVRIALSLPSSMAEDEEDVGADVEEALHELYGGDNLLLIAVEETPF